MLLLQNSLHCQSPLPPRSEIICVSAMAFKLLHRQGISRLFSNCPEQNFLTVEWRQSNHVTPCRKGSDINARHMECINAVLAMEPGITFSTGQATVDSTLTSTNSSDQDLTASSKRPELSVCMGTAQTDASLHAAKASVGTSPLEKLNCKEFEEQVQEEKERARRAKIGKANKGRVPWNKGKRGDSTESALQTQCRPPRVFHHRVVARYSSHQLFADPEFEDTISETSPVRGYGELSVSPAPHT